MSDSTIHIGRVSGVQANYNYDPVDQEKRKWFPCFGSGR